MIGRFARIHHKFGWGASAKTGLTLVGLVGMSLLGILGLGSWWPTVIAVVGLALGLLLRRQIVEGFEWFSWALPAGAFISGVLLFIGERLGLSSETRLIFITLTAVVVFNLLFWSLSDPSIVKVEDD